MDKNQLYNILMGALVGLTHVVTSNPKTEKTDSILMRALVACNDLDCVSEEHLTELIRLVNIEKNTLSPGCATCKHKCGNTDNYDMKKLHTLPDDEREAKLILCNCVTKNAKRISEKYNLVFDNDFDNHIFNENELFPIYQGVFIISEKMEINDINDIIKANE